MYSARIVALGEDENIAAVGVSWDEDELLSEGEVHHVSTTDDRTTVIAVVADESYRHAAIAQFWPADLDYIGALMLDRFELERLAKVIPSVLEQLRNPFTPKEDQC